MFLVENKQLKVCPSEVLLGINARGIWIFDIDTMKTLKKFKLGEIYRWGYKPAINFYFEIKRVGK